MTFPKIDSQAETQKIVSFIKETTRREGFSKVVVACSGGIDSSLTLTLAAKAIGCDNVLALKLPLANQSVVLANLAISFAEIAPENIFEINIKGPVEKIVKNTPSKNKKTRIRQGNIAVRTRMIYLYDLAKAKHALVCGTSNRSEHLLGYFTRYGDEAADLAPLLYLYKTQVISLANYLEIPQQIIEAVPSAGMWKGQTDEDELGFSYAEADLILHLFCDKEMKKAQIIKKGFNRKLVEKVIKRVKENKFKHRVPYSL